MDPRLGTPGLDRYESKISTWLKLITGQKLTESLFSVIATKGTRKSVAELSRRFPLNAILFQGLCSGCWNCSRTCLYVPLYPSVQMEAESLVSY